MTIEQAKNASFNIFDATKIWPIKDYPLIDVGTVTLDKNPENYYDDVEQVAFAPARTVPGVGPARGDKLLQGLMFFI
jgi:catalase